MRTHFRPEFVNRIDDFIVFQGLQKSQIESIARLQAKRVEQRLAAKKIKMVLEDSAVQFLAVSPCCSPVKHLLCACIDVSCTHLMRIMHRDNIPHVICLKYAVA